MCPRFLLKRSAPTSREDGKIDHTGMKKGFPLEGKLSAELTDEGSKEHPNPPHPSFRVLKDPQIHFPLKGKAFFDRPSSLSHALR